MATKLGWLTYDFVKERRYAVFPDWRKSQVVGFIMCAVLVIVLAVVASLGYVAITQSAFEYPLIGRAILDQRGTGVFIVGATTGAGIAVLLISLRLISDDLYEVLTEGLLAKGRRIRTVAWVVIAILLVCGLPAWAHLWFSEHAIGHESVIGEAAIVEIFQYLAKNCGGVVSFFISIITLLAFALTIQQLRDFQNRISSFGDMLVRVEKLSRSASMADPMHIIAFTPALGYLAQPMGEWDRLFETLTERVGNHCSKTRMIVLRESDLKRWHECFLDRRTLRGIVTQEDIDACNSECENIKRALSGLNQSTSRKRAEPNYIEVAFEDMPGYYCFFTASRAIIATPMFLPIRNLPQNLRRTLPSTHMIGYETGDRATVDDLFHQFNYLAAAAQHASTP